MSDVLTDPLIEQQKKTDAKQDAVIEQLRENQLALTGGLKDLVESNRDVLTLQQELPFPGVEAPPEEKPGIYELNKNFNRWELKVIKDDGFIEPNKLLNLEKENLNILRNNALEERNALSRDIGIYKRLRTPTKTEHIRYEQNEKKARCFEQISGNNQRCCSFFQIQKRIRNSKI